MYGPGHLSNVQQQSHHQQQHHQMVASRVPPPTYPSVSQSEFPGGPPCGPQQNPEVIYYNRPGGKDPKALSWEKFEANKKARMGYLNKKIHRMIVEEKAHQKYVVDNLGHTNQNNILPPTQQTMSRSLINPHRIPTTRDPSSPTGTPMVPLQTPFNGVMIQNMQPQYTYDGTIYHTVPRGVQMMSTNYGIGEVSFHQQNPSPVSSCTPVNQSFSSVSNVSNGSPCSMNASYSSTPSHMSPSSNSNRSDSGSTHGAVSANHSMQNPSAVMTHVQSGVQVCSPLSNSSANQSIDSQLMSVQSSSSNDLFGNNQKINFNTSAEVPAIMQNNISDRNSPASDCRYQASPFSQSVASNTGNQGPVQSEPSSIPIGHNDSFGDLGIPADLDLSGSFEEDLFRPDDSFGLELSMNSSSNIQSTDLFS
ncbi:uncharacterized protein LOC134846103 [Symsagittifera roscoffensis]|uniref:uncharacterized protein LOC134846103 n=1 Tax=Symsagittifera roscoffensis TaxID=84072 RepID=UPI00307CAB8E